MKFQTINYTCITSDKKQILQTTIIVGCFWFWFYLSFCCGFPQSFHTVKQCFKVGSGRFIIL